VLGFLNLYALLFLPLLLLLFRRLWVHASQATRFLFSTALSDSVFCFAGCISNFHQFTSGFAGEFSVDGWRSWLLCNHGLMASS
jgi:hypothetical protein